MKDNNKIYIIISIFAFVALILIIFFVLPVLKEIRTNSQDLILLKNNILALEEQTKEIENFKNNYDKYKSDLEKIDQLFVDPNNLVDPIKFLESSANDFNLSTKIFLPPFSRVEDGSIDFINFQITCKGSSLNILNFLKKIEAGPYLIQVENLTIQESQTVAIKDNSPKESSSVFTIKAFVRK